MKIVSCDVLKMILNLSLLELIQENLYYPTVYYQNFQLSDLKPTLPTPFKPVIFALLLSKPIVPPPRGSDNGGYTVLNRPN